MAWSGPGWLGNGLTRRQIGLVLGWSVRVWPGRPSNWSGNSREIPRIPAGIGMLLPSQGRQTRKSGEVPDKMGLIGVAVRICDVGQLIEFAALQMFQRGLELRDPGEQFRRYPDILLEPSLEGP